MNNSIKYQTKASIGETDPVLYKLAKGRSAKPHAVDTCGSATCFETGGQWISRVPNVWILETMVPIARVQSRHRVSPSPRKIPNYEIDIMVEESLRTILPSIGMPLYFVQHGNLLNNIRMQTPRFR